MIAFVGESFAEAFRLLFGGDPHTWHAIGLSLWTTLAALAIGAALAVPLGAALGVFRPPGSRGAVFALRVAMSFPTVAIGLTLYAVFSRRGPLGHLHLIYEPAMIVLGQSLLALPILASLVHAGCDALDPTAAETVRTHGGGRLRTVARALAETRATVGAALLLAFGRCITELGIVLLVGGTDEMRTRTLPALTTLDVSRGEFARGLASCLILVLLACGATAVALLAEGRRRR